ncbi:MAG: ABC transporter ATP-binding protein [Cytophagales bacterium]|nr:ABC transporter ATP-binding protein [Cytophagales bacterium]
MEIQLDHINKRFGKQWIFKKLDYKIESNSTHAICGRNGSGKSTLLKIISGYNTATSGKLVYRKNGQQIELENHITAVNYAAPYQQLLEELTLSEHLKFHFQFKESLISPEEIVARVGLEHAQNKFVGDFSSGMKQRLKLGLALFSQGSLLLLDEPTSNLDEQGIAWYKEEILKKKGTCTIIIASNLRYEYDFADHQLTITDFS